MEMKVLVTDMLGAFMPYDLAYLRFSEMAQTASSRFNSEQWSQCAEAIYRRVPHTEVSRTEAVSLDYFARSI